jgi:hypothetical protein
VKFVNLKRLGKQLRRELKAHPRKAALLALLLAVGVYYWAPVLSGWFSPKTMTTAPQTAQLLPAPPAPNTSSAAHAPVIPWQDLVAGMKRDPLKAPAANVHTWRDPFRPSARQVAILEHERQIRESLPKSAAGKGADATAKGIVVPPSELTPNTAGLSLTTTLVSATQRMAMIKGTIVEEDRIVKQVIVSEGSVIRVCASAGQEVSSLAPAGKKSAKSGGKARDVAAAVAELIGPTASFRVVRISPGAVTLEYRSREYELKLAKPKLAGNLKLHKAKAKE